MISHLARVADTRLDISPGPWHPVTMLIPQEDYEDLGNDPRLQALENPARHTGIEIALLARR